MLKRNRAKKILKKVGLLALGVAFNTQVFSQSVSDYAASPALLSDATTPLVMLALSNDHQLFYKAFTDYDNLDNDPDGVIETSYQHSFDYEGYFDFSKCYDYEAASGRFVPESNASNKKCSGNWSGNFLNWATMTRIDIIRKVLYGGYRSTDNPRKTVLERSYLPNDAHSFAKYYNGTDIGQLTPFSSVTMGQDSQNSGITICNTTVDTVISNDSTAPPLMRVVKGNYSLWAANERWQCRYESEESTGNGNNASQSGLKAASDNPTIINDRLGGRDFFVKVEVCNFGLIGEEDCKFYPSGGFKPIGILQQYGDDETVHFGLISGSYNRNKSGGVIRKNIGSIADEINVDTDGSFKNSDGIISTINKFRLANYTYTHPTSNKEKGTYNGSDNCDWGINTFNNEECTNWGNPFSEILLECYRYFAGAGVNPDFSLPAKGDVLKGLKEQTWVDPLRNQQSACASLNVIAFNASTSSYDSDEYTKGATALNLPAGKSVDSFTNDIGNAEGIAGKTFFVGEAGVASRDQLCTAKKVDRLSDVKGTCPDAPRLEGSYAVAGLAYHVHVNDIRSDIGGDQNISTYGVTLSPSLPKVDIPVPGSAGKKVTILPACRNDNQAGQTATLGNCGLVDFKIVENYQRKSNGVYTGKFYVNWEDSEQGGDYDQDMNGILEYEITANKLTITTDVFAESTSYRLGFGYTLSGTTADGFHVQSGIEGFSLGDCSNCQVDDAAASKTFDIGNSSASFLEQPLYYAAKFGGFNNVNGLGANGEPLPDQADEWDKINNSTGLSGADGLPDNYFLAIDPGQLKVQLEKILTEIILRTGSGTSAAVVSNSGTGEGAVYQALFSPEIKSAGSGSEKVEWVGSLHGLFIDGRGQLREDKVGAGVAGRLDQGIDPVVKIFFDPTEGKDGQTMVARFAVGSDGVANDPTTPTEVVELSQLEPIWDANDELNAVTNYVDQRSYTDSAGTGRYIFTAIDSLSAPDGMVDQSEVIPFTAASFNPNTNENYRFLDLDYTGFNFFGFGFGFDPRRATTSVVNFIRGQEGIPGARNRTVAVNDSSGNLVPKTFLLGDIVNSSPIAVGTPKDDYDVIYGDETYRVFKDTYQNRRNVVYVGANDGMLHAFNSGFFDRSTASFSDPKHPLGSELWAYVPYNLLPHLKWLFDENYPHVYYVDGASKVYDVNIFPNDTVHPGGWGTILVVGMRFGGGDYDIVTNNLGDTRTLRSAYIVLDITDPERPPTLLAEITHPDLGFTMANPALVKSRKPGSDGTFTTPSENEWHLVFGSGPGGVTNVEKRRALDSAVSGQEAKMLAFNLRTKEITLTDTGDGASFVGGLTTADWDNDYSDDALYYGLVAGTVDTPDGGLKRFELGLKDSASGNGAKNVALTSLKNLINISLPVSAEPLTFKDRDNNFWVYSGTGRFYVAGDHKNSQQQYFYGIKEPRDASGAATFASVNVNSLLETSGVEVFEGQDGNLRLNGASPARFGAGEEANTFSELLDLVATKSGWRFKLPHSVRERNTTKAVVAGQSLIFTSYAPSGQSCEASGQGYLFAPHLQAGVPGPFVPLDTNPGNQLNGLEQVNMSIPIDIGQPTEPQIHIGSDGTATAITQSSTGAITSTVINNGSAKAVRQSWREIPITW